MKSKLITSEYEALQALKQGNIDYLFKRYWRTLVYFCRGFIHDKEESEDMVIDIFVKLSKKNNDFDNYKDIESFLFTSAKNSCLDWLKHKKVIEKHQREMIRLMETDENLFERKVRQAELVSLYALIENLPASRKEIFKMLLEGMSTRDISDKLGISIDTIRVQKSRAINYLKLSL